MIKIPFQMFTLFSEFSEPLERICWFCELIFYIPNPPSASLPEAIHVFVVFILITLRSFCDVYASLSTFVGLSFDNDKKTASFRSFDRCGIEFSDDWQMCLGVSEGCSTSINLQMCESLVNWKIVGDKFSAAIVNHTAA